MIAQRRAFTRAANPIGLFESLAVITMAAFSSWMEADTATSELRVRTWGTDAWQPVDRVAETIVAEVATDEVVQLEIVDVSDGCRVQCVDERSELQAEFRFRSREEAVSFARSLATQLHADGPGDENT